MKIGEFKELENHFKIIKDTPDNTTVQVQVTKKLKKEIEALEKLSTILQTIGLGELVKLYTKKKMEGR